MQGLSLLTIQTHDKKKDNELSKVKEKLDVEFPDQPSYQLSLLFAILSPPGDSYPTKEDQSSVNALTTT